MSKIDILDNFEMDEEVPCKYFVKPNKQLEVKINSPLTSKDKQNQRIYSENIAIMGELIRNFRICKDAYQFMKFTMGQPEHSSTHYAQQIRSIIDFISDSRIIINFIENWAKNNLSKGAEKQWKEFESGFFDRFPAYRICYHLRNVVQHKLSNSFAVGKISENLQSNGKVKKEISLNKNALDKKFYQNAKIPLDFFDDDTKLSLLPYINAYYMAIKYLVIQAGRLFLTNDRIKTIKSLINSCRQSGYSTRVYYGITTKRKILDNDWHISMKKVVSEPMISDVLADIKQEGIDENIILVDNNQN